MSDRSGIRFADADHRQVGIQTDSATEPMFDPDLALTLARLLLLQPEPYQTECWSCIMPIPTGDFL